MEEDMKLQIKFKVETEEGSLKKVSKTFSQIDENAGAENYKNFALAYTTLIDATEVEVFLIDTKEI
jgi:hypothetical protein